MYGGYGVVVYCEASFRGFECTVGNEVFFKGGQYGFAAGMMLLGIKELFEGSFVGG